MIDVKKKGISHVYDYLLEHEIIEDLNAVKEELGLTIKRVYKISAELKDLDLCQTIDRPMKISLLDPQVAWERAVNKKIEELRDELNEKIVETENCLEEFFNAYKIQKVRKAPVEFVRYDGFEFVLYALWGNQSVQIANGIKYNNPGLKKVISEYLENRIPSNLFDHFKEIFQNLEIKVLLSEDALRDASSDMEMFREALLQVNPDLLSLSPRSFEVRVTNEPFSNFTLRDDEILMQPSFDPNNELLGSFITSQQEIVQIFKDKFSHLFDTAMPLDEFLQNSPDFQGKEYQIPISIAFAAL